MARGVSTKQKADGTKTKTVQIDVAMRKGESKEQSVARVAIRPTHQGAATIHQYGNWVSNDLGLSELIDALTEQTEAVIDGNLNSGEAMLAVQAHTLDAIFNDLARRAMTSEYITQFETYLKLGLRAQSQSKSTWETISEIQNPRATTFVKQANIAHGHQQVNNASRTGKNENPPNELLEHKEHEPDNWLDRGAPQEAVRVDQTLETVAKKHRPKDS